MPRGANGRGGSASVQVAAGPAVRPSCQVALPPPAAFRYPGPAPVRYRRSRTLTPTQAQVPTLSPRLSVPALSMNAAQSDQSSKNRAPLSLAASEKSKTTGPTIRPRTRPGPHDQGSDTENPLIERRNRSIVCGVLRCAYSVCSISSAWETSTWRDWPLSASLTIPSSSSRSIRRAALG